MLEDDLITDSNDIVSRAQKKGVIVRILGGVAIYMKIRDNADLLSTYKNLERRGDGNATIPDLDLAAYRKQRNEVSKICTNEMHFKMDPMVSMFVGENRLRFYNQVSNYPVDVFLSKLEFSHDVNFGESPNKGRLELDFPTISPTDLVLAKMQIHDINLKDLVDMIILTLRCEVTSKESSTGINGSYISDILSNDWGFWYDFGENVKKIMSYSERKSSEGKLSPAFHTDVRDKLEVLLRMSENTEKTKKWRAGAAVGTGKPWYRDVEELVRG